MVSRYCAVIALLGLAAAPLFATPKPAPAAAPVPQVVGHSVVLAWGSSPDTVDGYNVYRAPDCSTAGTKVNTAVVSGLAFTDASMKPGAYAYKVTATAGGAESAPSNCANAVILPAAPTGVRVTSSN